MTLSPDLQRLSDEADIRGLMMRFFQAVDGRDWALCETVFDETVMLNMGGGASSLDRSTILKLAQAGADVLPASLRRVIKRNAHVTEDVPLTLATHFAGNMTIAVDGDTAAAETYAIANMFFREGEQDYVLIRGIRYLDRFARTAQGWRITHRAHTLDWQRESPVDYVIAFENRPTLQTVWPS